MSDTFDSTGAPTTALALVPETVALAPKAVALAPANALPVASIAPRAHQHTARRNAAKPKPKPKTHHRNAGAVTAARQRIAKVAKAVLPEPPTFKEKAVSLVETIGSAGLTSVIGALAVRWGLHPNIVSIALAATGGYVAFRSKSKTAQVVGTAAASAAGSQLVLLQLAARQAPAVLASAAPASHPAAPQQPQPQPQPQPPVAPTHRAADLGALPPGMLDAAFERARSELAVGGEGYPPDYDYAAPRFHHGPVMP